MVEPIYHLYLSPFFVVSVFSPRQQLVRHARISPLLRVGGPRPRL
jgi:hypothetical protein